jgi:hypothetical protein
MTDYPLLRGWQISTLRLHRNLPSQRISLHRNNRLSTKNQHVFVYPSLPIPSPMAARRTQRTITIRPEQAVIPFFIRTDL